MPRRPSLNDLVRFRAMDSARGAARAACRADSLALTRVIAILAGLSPTRGLDMQAERARMLSTVSKFHSLLGKIACLGPDDEDDEPQQQQLPSANLDAAACAPAEQPITAAEMEVFFYQQQFERVQEERVRAAGRRCASEAACAALRRQILAREQRIVQLEQELGAGAAERDGLQGKVQHGREALQQLFAGITSLQAQAAAGAVIITVAAPAPGAEQEAAVVVVPQQGTPPPRSSSSSSEDEHGATPLHAAGPQPPSSCLSVRRGRLPTPQHMITIDDAAGVQQPAAAAAAGQQEPERDVAAAEDQCPPSRSPATASSRKQRGRIISPREPLPPLLPAAARAIDARDDATQQQQQQLSDTSSLQDTATTSTCPPPPALPKAALAGGGGATTKRSRGRSDSRSADDSRQQE